jgi:hypothetical protein
VAYCVAYSPDGQAAITGHNDFGVYITPLKP